MRVELIGGNFFFKDACLFIHGPILGAILIAVASLRFSIILAGDDSSIFGSGDMVTSRFLILFVLFETVIIVVSGGVGVNNTLVLELILFCAPARKSEILVDLGHWT